MPCAPLQLNSWLLKYVEITMTVRNLEVFKIWSDAFSGQTCGSAVGLTVREQKNCSHLQPIKGTVKIAVVLGLGILNHTPNRVETAKKAMAEVDMAQLRQELLGKTALGLYNGNPTTQRPGWLSLCLWLHLLVSTPGGLHWNMLDFPFLFEIIYCLDSTDLWWFTYSTDQYCKLLCNILLYKDIWGRFRSSWFLLCFDVLFKWVETMCETTNQGFLNLPADHQFFWCGDVSRLAQLWGRNSIASRKTSYGGGIEWYGLQSTDMLSQNCGRVYKTNVKSCQVSSCLKFKAFENHFRWIDVLAIPLLGLQESLLSELRGEEEVTDPSPRILGTLTVGFGYILGTLTVGFGYLNDRRSFGFIYYIVNHMRYMLYSFEYKQLHSIIFNTFLMLGSHVKKENGWAESDRTRLKQVKGTAPRRTMQEPMHGAPNQAMSFHTLDFFWSPPCQFQKSSRSSKAGWIYQRYTVYVQDLPRMLRQDFFTTPYKSDKSIPLDLRNSGTILFSSIGKCWNLKCLIKNNCRLPSYFFTSALARWQRVQFMS